MSEKIELHNEVVISLNFKYDKVSVVVEDSEGCITAMFEEIPLLAGHEIACCQIGKAVLEQMKALEQEGQG